MRKRTQHVGSYLVVWELFSFFVLHSASPSPGIRERLGSEIIDLSYMHNLTRSACLRDRGANSCLRTLLGFGGNCPKAEAPNKLPDAPSIFVSLRVYLFSLCPSSPFLSSLPSFYSSASPSSSSLCFEFNGESRGRPLSGNFGSVTNRCRRGSSLC